MCELWPQISQKNSNATYPLLELSPSIIFANWFLTKVVRQALEEAENTEREEGNSSLLDDEQTVSS